MKLEEIKRTLKSWETEISSKYSTLVVSKYEEPFNVEKGRESIFLLDVLIKKKVHLDNYGYVLSVRIFKTELKNFEITVDICEGDGNILKEKIYIIHGDTLPIESPIYQQMFDELSEYKITMIELVDKDISR